MEEEKLWTVLDERGLAFALTRALARPKTRSLHLHKEVEREAFTVAAEAIAKSLLEAGYEIRCRAVKTPSISYSWKPPGEP